MKNILYFLLLLVFLSACKKQDSCNGVVCQNGGHCENGTCICDSGYSGVHCEVFDSCFNLSCGIHGHCNNGHCLCDSGWTGSNCGVPSGLTSSIAGNYLVSGYYNTIVPGNNPYHDTTYIITNDTLILHSVDQYSISLSSYSYVLNNIPALKYVEDNNSDVYSFAYTTVSCHCYYYVVDTIKFFKSNPDSIWVSVWENEHVYNDYHNLHGRKIY